MYRDGKCNFTNKKTRHLFAKLSAVISKVCLYYFCNCFASAIEESAAEAYIFGYAVWPSVRPLSVSTYFARRGISLLSGGNSVKPGAEILTMWMGTAEKVLKVRGQRSKVKVTTRPNAIKRRSMHFGGVASRLLSPALNSLVTKNCQWQCMKGSSLSNASNYMHIPYKSLMCI